MTIPAAPPAPPVASAPVTPPATDPAAPATQDASVGAADEGTGDIAVVLMVPADAADALPVQDATGAPLFLTLAYLTKPSTMDSAQFLIAVLSAARDAATTGQPITGQINGLGRTSLTGTDDEFFALVESPDIEPLRSSLMDAIQTGAASDQANEPADGSPANEITDPGVYLPKITLGTVGAGDDLPTQRIEPLSATFDVLTLVQDATLIEVPLGAPANSPDSPAQSADAAAGAAVGTNTDTTAPNDGTKAGGPPISRGSYVKVGSQQGRVDLVVTSGKVPGVESDIEGSADNPALRIVVYTESGGSWKATGKRLAARANSVTRVAPLANRPASKKDSGLAALVGLQADHEARAEEKGWPEHAKPDGDTLKAVFERGTKSWPGETVTSLTPDQWALGRVKAFLATAAGERPSGYHRDDDLLPAGHPESKRAPAGEEEGAAETKDALPEGETADDTVVVLDPAEVKARREALLDTKA